MRIYLNGIAGRGELVLFRGKRPNLKLLAERCGVNRYVFYCDSSLSRMIESIARNGTTKEAGKSRPKRSARQKINAKSKTRICGADG